jgi:hypothetical protein
LPHVVGIVIRHGRAGFLKFQAMQPSWVVPRPQRSPWLFRLLYAAAIVFSFTLGGVLGIVAERQEAGKRRTALKAIENAQKAKAKEARLNQEASEPVTKMSPSSASDTHLEEGKGEEPVCEEQRGQGGGVGRHVRGKGGNLSPPVG